jgi:hypothetical protein
MEITDPSSISPKLSIFLSLTTYDITLMVALDSLEDSLFLSMLALSSKLDISTTTKFADTN